VQKTLLDIETSCAWIGVYVGYYIERILDALGDPGFSLKGRFGYIDGGRVILPRTTRGEQFVEGGLSADGRIRHVLVKTEIPPG